MNLNFPKEFKKMKLAQQFQDAGLCMGQMISGSKTLYRNMFPKHMVCFNGNIFVEGLGKVWWGDIDVTLSKAVLRKVAYDNQVTLYVLREMEGRFENEDRPDNELKGAAAAIFEPLSKQLTIEF